MLLAWRRRVDGGLWDRVAVDGQGETRNIVRDYWVALRTGEGERGYVVLT